MRGLGADGMGLPCRQDIRRGCSGQRQCSVARRSRQRRCDESQVTHREELLRGAIGGRTGGRPCVTDGGVAAFRAACRADRARGAPLNSGSAVHLRPPAPRRPPRARRDAGGCAMALVRAGSRPRRSDRLDGGLYRAGHDLGAGVGRARPGRRRRDRCRPAGTAARRPRPLPVVCPRPFAGGARAGVRRAARAPGAGGCAACAVPSRPAHAARVAQPAIARPTPRLLTVRDRPARLPS